MKKNQLLVPVMGLLSIFLPGELSQSLVSMLPTNLIWSLLNTFGARGPGSRTNIGRLQIRVCIDEIFHLMTVKIAVFVFCSVYFTRLHYLVPVVRMCSGYAI